MNDRTPYIPPTQEQRRDTKRLHEAYRAAAKRLYPDANHRELVTVNEVLDGDCAFIEIVVKIPRDEAEEELCAIV